MKYLKTGRNEMIFGWTILLMIKALVAVTAAVQNNNSLPLDHGECQLKIYSCTKVVRPMLNDVRYMFPTSLNDVDAMCKMWSRFVDCVRHYMSSCSTDDQRSKFNKAVSHSMDTVHAICSSDRHQKDYLKNAHCFRRVSVLNCGRYYRPLVAQVANREAEDTHICCAYGQFKGCVSAPLLRNCGLKVHALLDHSLSYLVNTCSSTFYPLSYQCPTAPPPKPLTMSQITSPLTPTTSPPPTTSSSTSIVSRPRTIIYTLPPTQGSRTSSACTGPDSLIQTLWILVGLSLWMSLRFSY